MRAFPVDEYSLLTGLALNFGHGALALAVEFHILAIKPKSTPLLARLENSVTLGNVSHGIPIGRHIITIVVCASELHLLQVLIHPPVHVSPLHLVVALAFLGATVVFRSPWLNAIRAENRLATAALLRVFHHEGTDRADKKVSSFLLSLL